VFLDNNDYKFHVLVLTETWFSADNATEVDGYNAYHSYRTDKVGGGVSVYVSDNLASKQLHNLALIGDAYEVCAASVCFGSELVYILGTYRPPSDADFEQQLDTFVHLLADFNVQSKKVFIAGDFNIDMLADDRKCRMFNDSMNSLFLLPLITIPTRIGNDSCTLIDHIWTNQLSVSASGVFVIDVTDHFPVFAVAQLEFQQENFLVKYFRDHSSQSLEKLETKVEEYVNSYSSSVENLEDEMSDVLSNLLTIYNSCCAIRSKIYSPKSLVKPWIDRRMRALITRKHLLFRQYRSGVCSFQFYNKFKNTVCTRIKNAKRAYFKRRFTENGGCASDMWNVLRKLLNRSRKSTNIVLNMDGSSITDDYGVATVFNEYFSAAADRIVESIPDGNVDPLLYMAGMEMDKSFFAVPSTPNEVFGIISSLKMKGSPLSEIPTFIYKRLNRYLCSLISDLFNRSVSFGIFPDVLKKARVVPIHKAGDVSNVVNYRPISTLTVMSKIFELLMCCRMKKYIEHFSLLGYCQFGFRQSFSTVDAISEFLDRVCVAVDSKQYFLSVFIDFQKAFDTVDHDILVRKLSLLGFRGPINDWLRSYLSNRKQYVSINNTCSRTLDVGRGVPQGSVLGPLLFNLYISDMYAATNLGVIHYADDTTVYYTGVDIPTVVQCVNDEMLKIDKWLCANKLSLNAAKSKVMLFTKRPYTNPPQVKCRDTNLDFVFSLKFLGVTLDADLSFRNHLASVISKLARSVGIMRKLSYTLPERSLLVLYYSLFYSHLVYSVVAWGNSSVVANRRIFSLQKQAVRLLNHNGVFPENFIKHNIMTFPFIVKYFSAQKLYRSLHNVDSYFADRVAAAQVVHGHVTRNSANGSLTNIFCRTSCSLRGFLPQAIRCWNEVPNDIRSLSSYAAFKFRLRQFFVQQSHDYIT